MATPTSGQTKPSTSKISPPTSVYKVYIAIDFGTDGIALAYAIKDKVYVHQTFKSKKYGECVKPKTIVLLDDDGEVNTFGIDAKFTLSAKCIYPLHNSSF